MNGNWKDTGTVQSVFSKIVTVTPPDINGVNLWNTPDGITAFDEVFYGSHDKLTFFSKDKVWIGDNNAKDLSVTGTVESVFQNIITQESPIGAPWNSLDGIAGYSQVYDASHNILTLISKNKVWIWNHKTKTFQDTGTLSSVFSVIAAAAPPQLCSEGETKCKVHTIQQCDSKYYWNNIHVCNEGEFCIEYEDISEDLNASCQAPVCHDNCPVACTEQLCNQKKCSQYALLGGIAAADIPTEYVFNTSFKGVGSIMGHFSTEEIMSLHARGYKVGNAIGPQHVNNFVGTVESFARRGYDFVVTDEIAWNSWMNYNAIDNGVGQFVAACKAAKTINSNILIGDVEPFYYIADDFLGRLQSIYSVGNTDAQADFIGGEDHAGFNSDVPISLNKLDTLKSNYNIPVHQWVTTVDIANKYIGKVDMVVLTNLTGTWGDRFPNWYDDAKTVMDSGDWVLCL